MTEKAPERYGKTRVTKIKAAYDALRSAVRSGDFDAAEAALDRYEQWADYVFDARHAPQWRPISEAPRDGTPILVFGQPEKHPHLNSWFERPVCIAAYWCAIDDAFCIMGGDWLGPFVNPTHFMPLPEAPNEQ